MQNAPNATEGPLDVGASKGAEETGLLEKCRESDFSGLDVNPVDCGRTHSDRAEGCPDAGPRERPAPGPSALPCQNSNNSPKFGASKGYKLHKRRTVLRGQIGKASMVQVTATEDGEGVDHLGRGWKLGEDGKTWERILGGVSSSEARTAFALRRNVEAFADHYERANCGFLTLTPDRVGMSPREFGEAWNAMRRHDLEWITSYLRVLEPQKRGAPHYHLCVATPFDLKPESFDWASLNGAADARKRGDLETAARLTRAYAASAPKELRDCWSDLRRVCKKHGLGRSEFLPFRKEAGAVAEYVGKYLESGLEFRQADWKGARRVEYDRKESRKWKRCGVQFGWVSPGAKEWRMRVGEMALAANVATPEGLSAKLGRKWCYHARADIMTANPFEWYVLLEYIAKRHGGKVVPRERSLSVGGKVLAQWTDSLEIARNAVFGNE